MPNYHHNDGVALTDSDIASLWAKYPHKLIWFAQNGYKPHYWQALFHTNTDPATEHLCRFRHLAAGRRGGKTLSAAWETIFYALHPEVFHMDIHGKQSSRPLHIWIVSKDYPMSMAALLAVREVLEQCGLTHGKEYKENRGNRWFEFENGTFLQFKTADTPQSLRGAGLDIMWYDEAAFIPSSEAWDVSRPALSDKLGIFIATTTPDGKNWYWNQFWSDQAMNQSSQGRVEYWSIDNPYFDASEWETARHSMHPMLFKQEYMAAFDSMAGKELSGEWLHYYEFSEIEQYKRPDGSYDLKVFIAVDPAISLADTADRFAITAIGLTRDNHQAYLLEQWAGRIPFPEQVDKINEWFQKWRPHYIGIERVAYQAALEQQVMRLEGLPPTVALWAKGKKSERIISMSPLFRIGKIKIRKEHLDFIDEWVGYDSTKKNPQDDCLDSMEMALRTAGVILPGSGPAKQAPILEGAASTASEWQEIANKRFPVKKSDQHGVDEHLGYEW